MSLDQIERACVTRASCDFVGVGMVAGPDIGACVTSLRLGRPSEGLTTGQVGCMAAAEGDCTAAARCLGYVIQPGGGECSAQCQDNLLVRCYSDSLVGFDCTSSGAGNTCQVETDPLGGTLAHCASDLCDGLGSQTCEGSRIVTCSGGARSVENCPTGTACAIVDGIAACTGTGTSCDASRCDGDVLVGCTAGREGERTDCEALGMRCGVTSGEATCLRTSTACGDYSSCREGVVRFCAADGSVREYDCVAHGWSGCDAFGWACAP